ncbi:hypothetical protein MBLNU457_6702t1 [Dothideomycetes sp. NU457]
MNHCRPTYYSYEKLPLGFIRLLRIDVEDTNDSNATNRQLYVHLEQQQLDTAEYDALSYAWGPSTLEEADYDAAQIFTTVERCYPVMCSDKIILVTRSLRNALRWVRRSQTPHALKVRRETQPEFRVRFYLWADGICMNQEDQEEKAQQVAIMTKLYERASNVIAYIGESNDQVVRAMRIAIKIGDIMREEASKGTTTELDQKSCERLDLEQISSEEWWDWIILFCRSFFSRTWILQESILGGRRNAVPRKTSNNFIQCGQYSMPLQGLTNSLAVVYAARWQGKVFGKLQDIVDHDKQYARVIQGYTDLSLYTCYRHVLLLTGCSDPRDKIYATLGFVSEWQGLSQSPFPIDYKLSVSEVYCRATKSALSRTGNLDMLCSVRLRDPKALEYGLPSWCPDYDLTVPPGKALPDGIMTELGGVDTSFSATGQSIYSTSLNDKDVSHYRLEARGIRRDVVKAHTKDDHGFTALDLMGHVQILEVLLEFAQRAEQNCLRSSDSPMESIRRTLTKRGYDIEASSPTNTTETSVQGFCMAWAALIDAHIWTREHSLRTLEKAVTKITDLIESIAAINAQNSRYLPSPTRLRQALELRKEHDGHPGRFTYLRDALCFDEPETRVSASSEAPFHEPYDDDHYLPVRISGVMLGRRFFSTQHLNLLGVSHNTLRAGDEVWLLAGSKLPFVLRPKRDGSFELIGEAYVDGLMFGQMWPGDENRLMDITLT